MEFPFDKEKPRINKSVDFVVVVVPMVSCSVQVSFFFTEKFHNKTLTFTEYKLSADYF